jgi:23S rRNA (uracil1939-C5)-methyltransferase
MIASEQHNTPPNSDPQWQQGQLIEVEAIDLSDSGDAVARWCDPQADPAVSARVVFVADLVVGDRALVRLTRVKHRYACGKLQQLLSPSPHRIRPRCIVADKCGGCQWQHISDEFQRQAKRQQVIQAFERLGGFSDPPVAPLLAAQATLQYRNKATYPLGIGDRGNVQAGYYRRGSHQLVNLNQCPVQDERLNPLLENIKLDLQARNWPIYEETHHQGKLRHLALRIGRHTGEMLLTLVSTDWHLPGLSAQANLWLQNYPQLVGVAVNHNPHRTNVILGEETRVIAGKGYLEEVFAGLRFQLRPETFFQVNTEAAEALLNCVIEQLNLTGTEILLDAYCGIGTFSLPLARHVKQVIGIELQAASVQQAQINAQTNQIANAQFYVGAVERRISQLDAIPDVVLLDPPRKGCDRAVLESLLALQPRQIVYVSCKPATQARDLKILCHRDRYELVKLQPIDFFSPNRPRRMRGFFTQKSLVHENKILSIGRCR